MTATLTSDNLDADRCPACGERLTEVGELRERTKMLDRIVERWALAFMQIRTMQGNPIEIARKAMDTCDDEQKLDSEK